MQELDSALADEPQAITDPVPLVEIVMGLRRNYEELENQLKDCKEELEGAEKALRQAMETAGMTSCKTASGFHIVLVETKRIGCLAEHADAERKAIEERGDYKARLDPTTGEVIVEGIYRIYAPPNTRSAYWKDVEEREGSEALPKFLNVYTEKRVQVRKSK